MNYQDLTAREGHAALTEDPELRVLDVRTPPEFASHRIDRAQLIPVHELPSRLHELDPDARYIVTCEHGVRSVAACQILMQAGFSDVINLRGGMAQWLAAGLPFTR